MWVPKEVADWFKISKESVDALREELAAIKSERDGLKSQLAITQNNFDWVRMQINQLQAENKALMSRTYGIQIPTPELTRVSQPNSEFNLQNLFTDERELEPNGWETN